MIETTYRDLAEFGLVLITPGEPAFNLWFEEILSLQEPSRPHTEPVPDRAAILENESDSPVIVLRYVWRYTTATGQTRTGSSLNLGSSKQINVLTGREQATPDPFSFILPGSRRLITEEGMFGDNRDVLPPQPSVGSVGWSFSRRGGRTRDMVARDSDPDVVRIELALDVAIFADGLCVGPDETGLRETLIAQIDRQKEVADQIARALRDGAPLGRIFEILRPLARHRPPAPPPPMDHRRPTGRARDGHYHQALLSMFANSALHQLVNADDATLPHWFEAAAAISPLQLRQPGE